MVIHVKDVACIARDSFEIRERSSNKEKFWCKRDSAPQWVVDLVYRAHGYGEMLPDDYRYEFIVNAVNALCECETYEEARDSITTDLYPYTRELLDWLGSRLDRAEYVDEAIVEYDLKTTSGIMTMISWGMYYEMLEVFDQVYAAIHDQLEAGIAEEGNGHNDENGGNDDV